MPVLGLYSLLNLPPAHRRLSARGCFKLIHKPLLSIYLVSLTIYFPQHLADRKRKILGRSLFASSQSHMHLCFLYIVTKFSPLSSCNCLSQLSGSDVEAIWNRLIQRLPSLQSDFCHRAASLCLPSFIGFLKNFFSVNPYCLEIQKQLDFPILQGPEFFILSIFIFPLKSATSGLSSCFLKYIPKAASSSQTHIITFSQLPLLEPQVH